LGLIIDGEGIRTDDKGIEAIQNFPIPDKTQHVQSFLGLCSYFRRFIKDFSTLAKPLYDLLRKDKKFHFWRKGNELLENKLVEAPVCLKPWPLFTHCVDLGYIYWVDISRL